MPVLMGEVMMATDMDYDSIAKSGLYARFWCSDRDGRTRCMVKSLLRLSSSISKSHAAGINTMP